MAVSVRPHHRFAAALIAAGVVSAASVVNMPTHPTMSVDVANTSAITATWCATQGRAATFLKNFFR